MKRDFGAPHRMPTRKPPATVRPPRHLRPATRKWFATVCRIFELEDHHLRLLQHAGEAWDRAEQARQALAEHGLIFLDRFDCPHARPEVAIERDSRIAFARLVRELDLDVAAPTPDSRGPALRSNRRT
jgi:phage terminase small subunit